MSNLILGKPFTLKCGLTLPNRLVKAAMAEYLATEHHQPGSEKCLAAYNAWASGGWGLLITGNVMVDPMYKGNPLDIAVDYTAGRDKVLEAWKSWAAVCNNHETKTIVQLNHPGRQSPAFAGDKCIQTKNLAPSAVALNFGDGLSTKLISSLMFGTPKEMSTAQIADVVQRFAQAAQLAFEAGFAGVQVHAAHGYLLSSFLSAATNLRRDDYGGNPSNRARIVVEIITAVRSVVPSSFCIAVKLNSADNQHAAGLEECVEQVQSIVAAGVDFIEVSGGSYENPKMMGMDVREPSGRTKAREAFFLDFATGIRRELPDIPLMVTGGFRSRSGMNEALTEGACDMIGIARPAVQAPQLPNQLLLNPNIEAKDAIARARQVNPPWYYNLIRNKAIGAGYESSWYSKQIHLMAQDFLKSAESGLGSA